MATDWVAITEALLARCGGYCERCGFGVHSYAAHRHHRRLRSQGGKDTMDNLVYLCPSCHQWVHQYPKDATAEGFIVPSWADPEDTPVYINRLRMNVWLLPEGKYQVRDQESEE